MKIPGLARLRRVARGVTNRFAPRALILLYHRVTDLSSDPQLLCVSPQHFSQHLEIIQKQGFPAHLKTLDRVLQRGTPGRCGVIVTFDDGYADNLYNAKPLLERYDLPATVFVATGYIDSQREFWKDALERAFLQPGTLPETLHLNINGTFYQWELGQAAQYGTEEFERYSCWNVTKNHDPTLRQGLYRTLCQLLQPLSERERLKALGQLLGWFGTPPPSRSTHRTLSADEVVQLADGGLIEIGSHTVTHPVLASLSAAVGRNEIRQSKVRLEEILAHPVTSFAYPYGGRAHYTKQTVAAVREAGYQRACSNFDGLVCPDSDRWELPRFLVRDWDAEEFACRFRDWLRS